MTRHAAVLTLMFLFSACKPPPAATDGSWQPSFMADPPKFDVDLGIQPMTDGPDGNVDLRWRLGSGTFSYSMKNRVKISTDGSAAGALETATEGSIEIDPISDDRAYLTMSSQLASGQGVPFTKTYKVDVAGRLTTADSRAQSILDLIFPLLDDPILPGQPRTMDVRIPDGTGQAETRGKTTVGITGFASVKGRTCAVVVLEHEAGIMTMKDGEMRDTGSTTRIELLGYFDVGAGRYLAVSIREHSVTYREVGKSVTDRTATYVLDGLDRTSGANP